jgi:peptidoglycan/xylan/chitin deacetylase (PgdA/CDA1 family)
MIIERAPFAWPGGKTLAVWVAPHVEVWDFDSTIDAALGPAAGAPGLDVINYAQRDYGIRVGLARVIDLLDRVGMRGSAPVSAAACELYPKQIAEMKRRGWEFLGHGVTNSRPLSALAPDEERAVIDYSVRTVAAATGTTVRGWSSPGRLQSLATPDLLAAAGLLYATDWSNDDQPYRTRVERGELYAIPNGYVIDDVELVSKGQQTGPQYGQSILDQFDQLLLDSRTHPRVLGIPLHPYVAGQPDRIGHLERALATIARSDGVWLATGGEIVEAYRTLGVGS